MNKVIGKITSIRKGKNRTAKRKWPRFIGLTIVELIIITLLILPFLATTSAQSVLPYSPTSDFQIDNLAEFQYQSDVSQSSSDDDDDDGNENDNGDDGGKGEDDHGDDGGKGEDDDGDKGGEGNDGDDETGEADDGDDEDTEEDTSQPSPSDDGPSNDSGGENTPQASPSSNESANDDNDKDDSSSDTSTPQFINDPRIFSNSGPASDRGIVPVFYAGNPQGGDPNTNCGFFNTDYREFRISKVDDTGSGNYSDGILSIDIVVTLSPTDGPSFDWSIAADSLVKALPGMFVKGGDNANWYDYSGFIDVPDGGATFDGMMHSPVNPTNGKFYGLSHVSFCYYAPKVESGGETGGGTGGRTIGGTTGVNLDTSGSNRASDGTSENAAVQLFGNWAPEGAAVDQTTDGAPLFLPTTGVAQIWDYSFIVAALIIGGLSLAAVSLHSYLLVIRPDL